MLSNRHQRCKQYSDDDTKRSLLFYSLPVTQTTHRISLKCCQFSTGIKSALGRICIADRARGKLDPFGCLDLWALFPWQSDCSLATRERVAFLGKRSAKLFLGIGCFQWRGRTERTGVYVQPVDTRNTEWTQDWGSHTFPTKITISTLKIIYTRSFHLKCSPSDMVKKFPFKQTNHCHAPCTNCCLSMCSLTLSWT